MLFQFIIISILINLSLVLANTNSKLTKYNINVTETSVSGISSGGYFATQTQIAFSSIIKGAGIIAAGHYNCADEKYLAYCMSISWPFSNQVSQTKSWSGQRVDPVENLKRHKVYMISGKKDSIVTTSNVDLLYDYYKSFIPESNIVYNKELEAGHTFPTNFDSEGNNVCGESDSPYISNCKFDGAAAILKQIYGNLKNRSEKLTGELLNFDQSEFIANPNTVGLSDTGYIYVPKACKKNQCRLHIVFHGCKQNVEYIGTKFIKNTGYDLWADNNEIILLFPQTHQDSALHYTNMNGMLNNINACWDWIGFYDRHFQSRDGKQISTIKKMIDRISGTA